MNCGGYLLKRTNRRGPCNYVANPGRAKSYTNKGNARVFPTLAEAEGNRCVENEIIIPRGEVSQ